MYGHIYGEKVAGEAAAARLRYIVAGEEDDAETEGSAGNKEAALDAKAEVRYYQGLRLCCAAESDRGGRTILPEL